MRRGRQNLERPPVGAREWLLAALAVSAPLLALFLAQLVWWLVTGEPMGGA